MNTIGIVLKPNLPQGKEVLDKLIPWLSDRKKKIRIVDLRVKKSIARVDMILVLGGDGTLLAVARYLDGGGIPVLAVNMGHLGFLTEIALDELYENLTRVFENAYSTDPRMMLTCVIMQGRKPVKRSTVLNDIVVHKGSCARGIPITVCINGMGVTEFRGDGLIVASATGSTAYTLSAGGPIVHPSVDAIVLTPLAPHILTHRPIVIPASSMIRVRVKNHEAGPEVAFDGQDIFRLGIDDYVDIKASPHRLNLIRSSNRNYYQVLREKLKMGWHGPQ